MSDKQKTATIIAICVILNAVIIYAVIASSSQRASKIQIEADLKIAKIETEREQIGRELATVNADLQRAKEELKKKPKERIIIKKIYETKRDSIFVLPFDDRLQLLAKRLPASDTLGGR
jgi:hypothetical protein